MLHILIMAGGKGERFWPKSRRGKPKQFLNIIGEGTMLQQTARRVCGLVDFSRIHVVTGAEYAPLVREQLPELPAANLIIEPEGRNTAPCIGLASLRIGVNDPDGTMAVLSSDHIIKDEAGFCNLLQQGERIAEDSGGVVTLGIKPDRPETGYGYIKMGQPVQDVSGLFKVEHFTEKPNAEMALEFFANGKYLWNSGMFIWKISVIRQLIAEFMPDLHQGLNIIGAALGRPDYDAVLRREFAKFEKISIDYGIMEHAREVYVLPAAIGWDDVGSWSALERAGKADAAGNILAGAGFMLIDTQGCICDVSGKKLIAMLGVKDLIYVETPDAVFICAKERTQEVKKLLEKIGEEYK